MSAPCVYGLFNIRTTVKLCSLLNIPSRSYAKKDSGSVSMIGGAFKKKKMGGKMGAMMEKKVLPVETDPERLVNYACGTNIYKTGEDVQLKPHSEYPEWLWSIRLGKPPPLEELDPNSKEYWRRIRKMAMRRNNQLQKLKKF